MRAIFLLLYLTPGLLLSQSSFIKTIDFNSFLYKFDLQIDDSDNLLISTGLLLDPLTILSLSPQGKMLRQEEVFPDSTDIIVPGTTPTHYTKHKSFHLLSTFNQIGPVLCCWNKDNNIFWSKKSHKYSGTLSRSHIISDSIVIYTGYLSYPLGIQDSVAISTYSIATGKNIWSYKYFVGSNNLDNILTISSLPNNNLLLNTVTYNNRSSGLTEITPSGIPKNAVFLRGKTNDIFSAQAAIDKSGFIYVSGRVNRDSSDWTNKNKSEGIVAKLNQNLDVIWAKRLSAPNFEYEGIKHKVSSDGEVVFVYHTKGDLPVIVGKLDTDGNLLWHRGYSFYDPKVAIGSDESIYFLSTKKYHTDGSSEKAIVLAKTDSLGNIEDCPQFDACLELFDLELLSDHFVWDYEPSVFLEESTFTIEPQPLSTVEDYCGTPRPPSPFFQMPDTICQGECLRPDSVYNHLAHKVAWSITEPSGNVIIKEDSLSFRMCFNEVGTYIIEQEVWLLGCSEFFARRIEVVGRDLNLSLGNDSTFCEIDTFLLRPSAGRPLKTFSWNNADSTDYQLVRASGSYAVTASDGFCTDAATVNLTFFKEWLNGEAPFVIPKDTAVCEELLPYRLTPQSSFTNMFFLDGSDEARSSFDLNRGGDFTIEAMIEGCRVQQVFHMEETGCEVPIFIPNSFSPNGDGINDVIQPFGQEHQGIILQIFNRWGGLVFETTAPPFAWDGLAAGGKPAGKGVYVFVFRYINLRTGKEEMISTDVSVVR